MQLHAPLDDRTAWSPVGHCPIEKAMAVVGSRPAMLLMREAHYGTRRFDDFVTRVGVAPATASTHLKALADAGDRKSTRLNSSHVSESRMPSSA